MYKDNHKNFHQKSLKNKKFWIFICSAIDSFKGNIINNFINNKIILKIHNKLYNLKYKKHFFVYFLQ